ncbi:MAG: hypothetical protein KAS12_04010 [Candidatus Aenigmarchaeota archaeon]|nr:hypothetical protein [Candidatus Aenigmarchaeota archaeon]
MNDFINDLKNAIHNFWQLVGAYTRSIKSVIPKNVNKYIIKSTKKINLIIDVIDGLVGKTMSVEIYFQCFLYIENIKSIHAKIHEILMKDDYSDEFAGKMSYTFNEDLALQRKLLINELKSFNELIIGHSRQVATTLNFSSTDLLAAYKKHPTVSFLLYFLDDNDNDEVFEEIKIEMFKSETKLKAPIQTFGLIPLTKYMTFNAGLKSLELKKPLALLSKDSFEKTLQTSNKKYQNFASVSEKLVIAEYDIRRLIDAGFLYTQNMNTNPAAGLSFKTIKRFETIKILPPGEIDPGKSGDEVIIPKDSEVYIDMIEDKVRFMIGNQHSKNLNKNFSSRTEQYNKIITQEIMKNINSPGFLQLIDEQPDINKIKSKIRIIFENIYTYMEILHQDSVSRSDVLANIMQNLWEKSQILIPSGNEELLLTYLLKYEDFMDEYKKNVKQKILEIFPKGELFLKLDKKARNEEIRSRMTTVGLQAIELMILRNKSSLVFAPKTLKAQYLRLNN